jgi:membrane-bound ClpP family serine protease
LIESDYFRRVRELPPVCSCAVGSVNYAGAMELVITLLAVGILLLLAESILPGVIAGVLGAGCLMGGIVEGYAEFGARTGNLILMLVLVGLTAGFCFWLKFFPNSRLARLIVSRRVVGDIGAEQPELVNQIGTAFSQLRPAGTALINGRRVDVVTEGQLIERGATLKVVAVEGMRVVVRSV